MLFRLVGATVEARGVFGAVKDDLHGARLRGLAIRRVEVGDAGRVRSNPGPVVARIREELTGLGPPPARIEHRRGGLVGEQLPGGLEPLEQARVHRPEREGGLAHPVGGRGAVEADALPGIDLGLAGRRADAYVFLYILYLKAPNDHPILMYRMYIFDGGCDA